MKGYNYSFTEQFTATNIRYNFELPVMTPQKNSVEREIFSLVEKLFFKPAFCTFKNSCIFAAERWQSGRLRRS